LDVSEEGESRTICFVVNSEEASGPIDHGPLSSGFEALDKGAGRRYRDRLVGI
jgi:hypothetical protein